uniref:GFA family protein n=2 Tax=Spongiibacteraceae TaxID=1706375 RepID=UPI0023565F4F
HFIGGRSQAAERGVMHLQEESMNIKVEHRGTCLCGAVRIAAKTKSNSIGACHCTMCRKWGGGPLFAAECESDVNFEGVNHISTFSSSEWAERGFCQVCGTHLFYRLKQEGHYAIPVGLFNGGDQWSLTEQIFIDQKPPFYSFTQKTKDLTGEEVFAQYSEK